MKEDQAKLTWVAGWYLDCSHDWRCPFWY